MHVPVLKFVCIQTKERYKPGLTSQDRHQECQAIYLDALYADIRQQNPRIVIQRYPIELQRSSPCVMQQSSSNAAPHGHRDENMTKHYMPFCAQETNALEAPMEALQNKDVIFWLTRIVTRLGSLTKCILSQYQHIRAMRHTFSGQNLK